jgi:hypothetical protein
LTAIKKTLGNDPRPSLFVLVLNVLNVLNDGAQLIARNFKPSTHGLLPLTRTQPI